MIVNLICSPIPSTSMRSLTVPAGVSSDFVQRGYRQVLSLTGTRHRPFTLRQPWKAELDAMRSGVTGSNLRSWSHRSETGVQGRFLWAGLHDDVPDRDPPSAKVCTCWVPVPINRRPWHLKFKLSLFPKCEFATAEVCLTQSRTVSASGLSCTRVADFLPPR